MRATLAALLVLAATSAASAERSQPPASFAAVADAVKASVVSVVMLAPPGHGNDEALSEEDLLRRLFDVLAGLPNRTLGAGVMLRPDVAVTGARLLRGLTELELVAVDGRHHRATVVGRDERTDIAVLRVSPPAGFPVARLADSDRVRVGDWVLAVGSPYGFEASVSAGIVSARARGAAGGEAGDLIQTDAAINPGSVGGPLVDTRGDVIGLAMTAAPRGAGIGFAVASNVVGKVVDDILTHGHVVRSWLGIAPQPLSPGLARVLRLPFAGGVLLADVIPGGPVAKAGLARGAIILALDRRPIRSPGDLDHALRAIAPGQTVTLAVWRNARDESLRVRVEQEPSREPSPRRWLGVAVEGITPDLGVVVTSVSPNSPAGSAGVLRGDILREIDRRFLRSVADFEDVTAELAAGRPVMVLVQRGGASFYLAVDPDG
jgi:serine protease Do